MFILDLDTDVLCPGKKQNNRIELSSSQTTSTTTSAPISTSTIPSSSSSSTSSPSTTTTSLSTSTTTPIPSTNTTTTTTEAPKTTQKPTTPQACGCNEKWSTEAPVIEPTCSKRNPQDPRTKSGCTCLTNYIKDDLTDSCILERDCGNCVGNSTYQTCGSKCPTFCSDVGKTDCVDYCDRGCFCNEGYVRNGLFGDCVPLDQCP